MLWLQYKNVYFLGGYLPVDGYLRSCSFVRTGFLVTIVLMTIWYIVGIFAGLVLLVVLCMFKGNKLVRNEKLYATIIMLWVCIFRHVKATSPKFNIILNLSICGMFVSGLILLALFYLGIKENNEKTTAHLCDVCNIHQTLLFYRNIFCLWYTGILYHMVYIYYVIFFYFVGKKLAIISDFS